MCHQMSNCISNALPMENPCRKVEGRAFPMGLVSILAEACPKSECVLHVFSRINIHGEEGGGKDHGSLIPFLFSAYTLVFYEE